MLDFLLLSFLVALCVSGVTCYALRNSPLVHWIKPHLYGCQNLPLRCGLILSVACIWIMRCHTCNICISVWSRSLLLSLVKPDLPPEISSKLQPPSYTPYTGYLLTSITAYLYLDLHSVLPQVREHIWMDNQHLVRFSSTKEVCLSLPLHIPRPFQKI